MNVHANEHNLRSTRNRTKPLTLTSGIDSEMDSVDEFVSKRSKFDFVAMQSLIPKASCGQESSESIA